MTDRVSDQAVLFGRRRSLVGIVSRPMTPPPGERPAVLILNTGIIHRVGHHRMYVTLARMLAEAGHTVLRFDQSGIGDSESRADDLPPLEAALADIREAVDWLVTARQARRIILIGLCWGADHALIYSGSDDRVVGLVLLDSSIPPTRRYYVNYAVRQFFRPSNWMDLAVGRGRAWKWARARLGFAPEEARESHRLKLGDPQVRAYLGKAYRKTVELGVQILAVFTSGFPHQHNYREQLLDAFPDIPFEGQLRLEYFSGCDHVFTSERDRARLFRTIMEWTGKTGFVEPASAPPASAELVG